MVYRPEIFMDPSRFPISVFPSANVSLTGARRAPEEDDLTETELAQLFTSFMQPSTEARNGSGSGSSTASEADFERDQARPVLGVLRHPLSGSAAAVDEDAANGYSDSGYSTSIVFSDDEEDDEFDPFYRLRTNIHALYVIAVMVDLRAEQTYMRAIAKAGGSILEIAWITIKDQVLVQFAQGFGLKLLKILLVPWFRGTIRSGQTTGGVFKTTLLGVANYIGKRLSLIPKPS
ncbi:hypothetical protein V1523DRAFT_404913 [Lipomyces doorenjongii]